MQITSLSTKRLIVGGIAAAILTTAILSIWEHVWSVLLLDVAALFACVLPLALTPAFMLKLGNDVKGRVAVARYMQWFLLIASGVTLYVAYGSFRNQVRLASEADLNQEAMSLYEIETLNPQIRCLYDNYGNSYFHRCRSELINYPHQWSLAMLYIEESWFILERAGYDSVQWRSSYRDSLKYWREDIAKDPTKLFSFQLVSTSDSASDVKDILNTAGFNRQGDVQMSLDAICSNYRFVVAELKRSGRWANQERAYCVKPF